MYKVLTPTLMMLFLFGCNERAASEQSMLNNQAAMLKSLCKNESACSDKIDTLSKSCHQSHAYHRDFDAFSEMDQFKAMGDFGACIVIQMDRDFKNRFDQAMPVSETEVEMTRPSHNTNSKGLLVRIMQDSIRITEKSKQNKDLQLKNLKNFIENQKLAERYSWVLLFVDEDADTGDMVEVMDVFNNAGIEQIHISARK